MSDDFPSAPPAPEMPPAPPAPPMAPPVAPMGGDGPSDTGKLLAGLSYVYFLWPIVGIIALLLDPYKDEKFVRTHAIQSLALGLAIWLIGGLTAFVLVGFLIIPAGVIYGIILGIKAFQGQTFEVPIIYNLVKQYI